MAPCIGNEVDFSKSKCTEARLKVMYKIRLLPHRLSSRYHSREDTPTPHEGEIVMFASFFLTGLVPSFFEFFTIIISFYDVHHLHLNPNSIIMLSIFAHMSENFIVVEPCLNLFRYCYTSGPVVKLATRSC